LPSPPCTVDSDFEPSWTVSSRTSVASWIELPAFSRAGAIHFRTAGLTTDGAGTIKMCAILFGSLSSPYSHAMDNVTLPPELERFATEAVAAGRYRNVADVVAAGVSLLQRQEQARAELLASVLAAKEESDRSGYLNGDEVAERVRATIARRANAAA
jgi:putative addiction module CopG family antidote